MDWNVMSSSEKDFIEADCQKGRAMGKDCDKGQRDHNQLKVDVTDRGVKMCPYGLHEREKGEDYSSI